VPENRRILKGYSRNAGDREEKRFRQRSPALVTIRRL
jgi:hypothetical protein